MQGQIFSGQPGPNSPRGAGRTPGWLWRRARPAEGTENQGWVTGAGDSSGGCGPSSTAAGPRLRGREVGAGHTRPLQTPPAGSGTFLAPQHRTTGWWCCRHSLSHWREMGRAGRTLRLTLWLRLPSTKKSPLSYQPLCSPDPLLLPAAQGGPGSFPPPHVRVLLGRALGIEPGGPPVNWAQVPGWAVPHGSERAPNWGLGWGAQLLGQTWARPLCLFLGAWLGSGQGPRVSCDGMSGLRQSCVSWVSSVAVPDPSVSGPPGSMLSHRPIVFPRK